MYEELMAKRGVVGVGLGKKNGGDENALVVLVEKKLPLLGLRNQDIVPSFHKLGVEYLKTDVIEVGHIVAQKERTDEWNPMPGGISIGHFGITAGTLGMWVTDQKDGKLKILSNNHVLANSNEALQGDPILQPGKHDGGTRVVARLERFVTINFDGETSDCPIGSGIASIANAGAAVTGRNTRLTAVKPQAAPNYCDAALADPLDDIGIDQQVLEIGNVSGMSLVGLGEAVRKSGRTTQLTQGNVIVLSATITVSYGGGRNATFDDQIVTGYMSAGGDSGSVVVNAENQMVGLLFAGSDQVSIHNPASYVAQLLGVTI